MLNPVKQMGAFLGVVCAAAKPSLSLSPLEPPWWWLLPVAPPALLPSFRPSVSRGGLWVDCGPSASGGAAELLGYLCSRHSWAVLAAVSSWSCTPVHILPFFLNKLVRVCQVFVSQNRVFLCFLVFVVFFFCFLFLLIRSIFISFVFFVLSQKFLA